MNAPDDILDTSNVVNNLSGILFALLLPIVFQLEEYLTNPLVQQLFLAAFYCILFAFFFSTIDLLLLKFLATGQRIQHHVLLFAAIVMLWVTLEVYVAEELEHLKSIHDPVKVGLLVAFTVLIGRKYVSSARSWVVNRHIIKHVDANFARVVKIATDEVHARVVAALEVHGPYPEETWAALVEIHLPAAVKALVPRLYTAARAKQEGTEDKHAAAKRELKPVTATHLESPYGQVTLYEVEQRVKARVKVNALLRLHRDHAGK